MTKYEAINAINLAEDQLTGLSDAIWDHPQVKYHETFAARLLCDFLKAEGFEVTEGVAGIPTAFVASFGSGKPVIGFLAEYDALDGLSQKANLPAREPVTAGAPGHGCGHNLLGVGAVGAALAVRDYLRSGKTGTVKLFGCPAEEGGSGKTFMAREGVFNGTDVALTWHPGDTNNVAGGSNLANVQVLYRFHGKAAHAAICPELGRSALDAVELLNIGVQFLREHIPSACRVHYAITDAGGMSPNTVQAEAAVMYLMRAPQLPQVRSLNQRVDDIARGAALMTGTSLEVKFIKAVSNVLPNKVLGHLLQKNMDELGAAEYDEADRALARAMRDTMEQKDDYYSMLAEEIEDSTLREELLSLADDPIYERVLPYPPHEKSSMASSDVGDVSWICPTAEISTATMPAGTGMHSWQEVAVGKSGMAHKGMLQASRILAAAAIDLLDDPSLILEAKKEQNQRTSNQPYTCPIPDGVQPQMD